MSNINLRSIIGNGYDEFWRSKKRYRAIKGSRRSKKSKTTAINIIWKMMEYAGKGLYPNTLVIRKTYRTLEDSCFAELSWAIHRLQVDNLWDIKHSPLQMIYKPTGQKILFRGLDDPLKATSMAVVIGSLCWVWIEEAYEITKEDDFNTLEESIIGNTPEGLYKQITLTFNPWNEHTWLKSRFFDKEDEDTFAITTNYLCNEWLGEDDLKVFEKMKLNNPRRYQVAGLGNWGITDGLIYDNWEERKFELEDIRHCKTKCGLDFGFTNDPSAAVITFLDKDSKTIYVWDELYKTGLINNKIFEELKKMGYGKENFTGDSAEPKSIEELKYLGMRIKGARKGKDSIMNGIQWIQDYHIVIHPRCVNFITEISNYSWDEDKFGKKLNRPIDDFNHLMDALRYALEDEIIGNQMEFSMSNVFAYY